MTETTKITPADIESKFREIQGQVDTVAEDSKKKVAIGGTILAIILLTIIYAMGQSSGKKKSTVLEIRRL
ncbi:MAG: hypothetical protein R2706_17800 [Acidimicrobiales bacterium]